MRRQHFLEHAIHPIDDTRLRAEVTHERQRLKPNVTDAFPLRPQEQTNLGLAKAIDRLHRVANHEQRSPIALLPARCEAQHQLVLAQRRVLKLIDEQMTNPIVECQRQLGGRLEDHPAR